MCCSPFFILQFVFYSNGRALLQLLVKWTPPRMFSKEFFKILRTGPLQSTIKTAVAMTEAALHRCSYKKVFWKYPANLQVKKPCRSVISVTLQNNFTEIKLRYGCSPVNLLHIFRAPFPKNTYGGLLLQWASLSSLPSHWEPIHR